MDYILIVHNQGSRQSQMDGFLLLTRQRCNSVTQPTCDPDSPLTNITTNELEIIQYAFNDTGNSFIQLLSLIV